MSRPVDPREGVAALFRVDASLDLRGRQYTTHSRKGGRFRGLSCTDLRSVFVRKGLPQYRLRSLFRYCVRQLQESSVDHPQNFGRASPSLTISEAPDPSQRTR